MNYQGTLMAVAVFLILPSGIAADDTPVNAPPPAPVFQTNEVVVSVASRADRDASGIFTYSYSVQNADTSLRPVALWALELGQALSSIQDVQTPDGWTFLKCSKNPVKLCWEWSGQDANALKPGYTLTGFSFRSSVAPDTIRFYAQNLPDGTARLDDTADLWGKSFYGHTVGPK